MDQLSSCYFCGAALDASLDEYPVIPKQLHPDPDDQRTVVLCRGCREKLGTVVETVVGAVDDDSARAETEPSTGPTEGTADRSSGDGREAADSRADGADAGAGAERGPGAEREARAEGEPRTETEAGSETGAGDPLADDGTRSEPDAGGRTAAEPDADAGASEADEASRSSSESPGYSEGRAAGNTTTAGGSEAGEDGDDADDGPSMTALEYNKVMRLLQNREFPVDREEIRAVAVNAYEISGSEFDAIIDAAVEKGLIGEEDGQFVEGN